MCRLKPSRWYITDANLKNGQKILTRMLEFVRLRPCIINSTDFGSQKPQIKSHCSNYNSVVIVLTQWDKLTSWCSRLVSALVISIFHALRILNSGPSDQKCKNGDIGYPKKSLICGMEYVFPSLASPGTLLCAWFHRRGPRKKFEIFGRT